MGYMCDANDERPAVWLVQNIDEGEILTLCDEHYVAYVQEVYLTLAGQVADPSGPAATDPVTGDETDEDEHADVEQRGFSDATITAALGDQGGVTEQGQDTSTGEDVRTGEDVLDSDSARL